MGWVFIQLALGTMKSSADHPGILECDVVTAFMGQWIERLEVLGKVEAFAFDLTLNALCLCTEWQHVVRMCGTVDRCQWRNTRTSNCLDLGAGTVTCIDSRETNLGAPN